VDLRDLVDDALEVSVVGSFSRIGWAVRRQLYRWPEPTPGSLEGRVILVTGPTSGLGRAIALSLAELGAGLILVGRDAHRLTRLADDIADRVGAMRVTPVVADMSSTASVDDAVARIRETVPRLDALIDNAGAIHQRRTLTVDGLEATFATMVVQPFRLVHGLLPMLADARPGQVVAVTSGGMYAQALDPDDLWSEREPYDGVRAYARAKRAQVVLIREWARRFRARGIRFDAMHPGWADTPGLQDALPRFHGLLRPILRSPAEGADTAVWLAAGGASGRPDGRLYLDRRERPFDRVPWTRVDAPARAALWERALELAGLPDPM
jgi:dehydrogenase/reductase SDR family member 12